jgi:D-arabinitol 4-dehydrogenase
MPMNILHLGLGSFHRAHMAVYLHAYQQLGHTDWTLNAGNTRPDMLATIAALTAQQGRYTLETVTHQGERSYLEVSSLTKIVPWALGLPGLIAIGADPQTRIVSFTVTEAGYFLDANDLLDVQVQDVQTDIAAARIGEAGGAQGSTIYGALYAILKARQGANAGKLTLLNCDNLRHNGERARTGLLQFIAAVGDASLRQWVLDNTTSPNAMVDRITPRPAPEVQARVKAATGRQDGAALMAESFIQWVIEDNFANGRPAWESVGVEMVKSVQAHEEAKIRLLNAAHSCIAWAGTLRGYQFIHEGTLDHTIEQMAFDYATQDAIPALTPSPIDLPAYRDIVLQRFANPAICDTNQRVAMDGFSKIPGFIAPTIRERLAAGKSIDAVAMLPALFLACLQRWHLGRLPYTYEDQAMDPAVAHAICASTDPVKALVANAQLWHELANDERLLAALRAAYARVQSFESKPA